MAIHSSILAWRIPMDRGAWWATVRRVAQSQKWLNRLSTHTQVNEWVGFPKQLSGKESTCDAGDSRDVSSIPGSGRSPGEGNGNGLQCSCLENPMNRGAWWLQSRGSQRVRYDWVTEHTQVNESWHLETPGIKRTYRNPPGKKRGYIYCKAPGIRIAQDSSTATLEAER